MSVSIPNARYHRSPIQKPYPYKESEAWGKFVRDVELGDDGFALRHVDEYENGYLSRYGRMNPASSAEGSAAVST